MTLKDCAGATTSPPRAEAANSSVAAAPAQMSLAALYERIAAATCTQHGLGSEEQRELHIRAIVETVLKSMGMLHPTRKPW